jgi:hypothetical protein
MQLNFPKLFENIPEETLKWGKKKYFAVENIQVIAEGEMVSRFANGAMCVLYNHHLFTKPCF